MAKRKDIETAGAGEAVAGPQATPEAAPADNSAQSPPDNPAGSPPKAESKSELPIVESPSISLAISEPVAISEPAIEPKPEPEVEAANSAPAFAFVPLSKPSAEPTVEPPNKSRLPRFVLRPRHKRYARLAASVALGAALGAVFGALATGGLGQPKPIHVATLEENKATQQSVAKLAKEVTTLKADLESANRFAHTQVFKIGERLKQEGADITGSISTPQTIEPAAAAKAATPLPTPRPAPRIAMAESLAPARLPVVQGWSIRDARDGYIYVEGHGDIYQIVPGAPLPGLGPVESIKRLDGRWVVTTPKGIIVSMRDRRYFE